MPFTEMITTLFSNAMHASAGAFVIVPLIFIYFTWMAVMAIVRTYQNVKNEKDHH
ncbi:MAG: hypothetical protein ACRCV3_04415 [Desulfovibrionaceae bacterium]